MNTETLEALNNSIAHWESMKDDPSFKEVPDSSYCPLCSMFAYVECCRGCPVYNKTGRESCSGTPYTHAFDMYMNFKRTMSKENWLAWQEAAQKEIDFLKSLLP